MSDISDRAELLINQILAALPLPEYNRLAPHLKPVNLISGAILLEPNEPIKKVYFPQRAMISLVSIMMDGSSKKIEYREFLTNQRFGFKCQNCSWQDEFLVEELMQCSHHWV